MKNIATIFLMLSISACAQPDVEPEVLKTSRYNSPKIDMDLAYTDPYEIEFSIENSTPDMYYLVITLNPKGGSFYVSPHLSRISRENSESSCLRMSFWNWVATFRKSLYRWRLLINIRLLEVP
jgi:hypothetical protein